MTIRTTTSGPSGPPGPAHGDVDPHSIALTHKQILTILIGLMAGMLLAALDQTIVSTSIRTIADDLHGLSAQAWVTTAYLITSTVTTPLYGKLSDIYGRRPMFLTAISIFIFGSMLCTFSTSMYELAAFRAIQGIGAGGLFSHGAGHPGRHRRRRGSAPSTRATSWPSSACPRSSARWSAASSPAPSTILGITGWRWVFLVNVPIGIVALFVVRRMLHIPHIRPTTASTGGAPPR